MNALEIRGLSKEYPGFRLDIRDLTLPSGCIMGLVGENGAGKTTTIKLILGAIRKNAGTVRVLGQDTENGTVQLREDIGVVFDEVGIPEYFTLKQVEKVMSGIFSRWDSERFRQLTAQMQLPEGRAFREMSKGMKMKLGIAVAMSHHAKLLILDEPTSGLDPVARDEVVEMLAEFTRDEEHSILISSHIVSDLEKLCDYVAFVHRGRLLLCEEKDYLLSEYGILHGTPEQLAGLEPGAVLHRRDTSYGCEALVLRSRVPESFSLSPVGLEDLFLTMVKEDRR